MLVRFLLNLFVSVKTNEQAVLLLGSNMGERKEIISLAVEKLNKKAGQVIEASSIYESEAWGFSAENSFLNQVIKIDTNLSPSKLLDEIQQIENELGRIRTKSGYESRTIDIDILFYGYLVLNSERLTIPHPQIRNRLFTLEPLVEIMPDFTHPVLKERIKDLLYKCEDKLWVKKFSDQ